MANWHEHLRQHVERGMVRDSVLKPQVGALVCDRGSPHLGRVNTARRVGRPPGPALSGHQSKENGWLRRDGCRTWPAGYAQRHEDDDRTAVAVAGRTRPRVSGVERGADRGRRGDRCRHHRAHHGTAAETGGAPGRGGRGRPRRARRERQQHREGERTAGDCLLRTVQTVRSDRSGRVCRGEPRRRRDPGRDRQAEGHRVRPAAASGGHLRDHRVRAGRRRRRVRGGRPGRAAGRARPERRGPTVPGVRRGPAGRPTVRAPGALPARARGRRGRRRQPGLRTQPGAAGVGPAGYTPRPARFGPNGS